MTLSGTGTDQDTNDTQLEFQWTQTGEPAVALTAAASAMATFTAPSDVSASTVLTFTLQVTDAGGLIHEDTVTVTVEPQVPVINSATRFMVAENITAVATLTATDADTPAGELTWSIPEGDAGGADAGKFTLSAAGVLEFASAKNFEIPDDANGDRDYNVTVQVSDPEELTGRQNLTVTLTDVNEAPTADAGDDRSGVVSGTVVTLDGSASSDQDAGDNDNLSYRWTQTGEPTVTLADANAYTTTFTAPSGLTETTTLSFTLTVTDGDGLSDEDTVTVTLVPQSPVITSETSFTVAENTTEVATLMATDADTPPAGLAWSIPEAPAGGADGGKFALTSSGVLTFASAKDFEDPDDDDTNGRYQVTVRVRDRADDDALEATANLTVTLRDINEAPTAVADADQTDIVRGATVTLDGSGSSDQDDGDNDNLIYRWTQTAGPAVTLTDAGAATTTFTAPGELTQATDLTFTLRVTDPDELAHEDSVTVTVHPPLTAGFENLPQGHDGTTRFSVDLRFSEDVALNAAAFSNGLLTITGGTLHGQSNVDAQSNIVWRIDIDPDFNNDPSSNRDVVITLPADRACDPDAAPCTSDGRRLSASASVTVKRRTGPVFSGPTSFTVPENTTAVATLAATDDFSPAADLDWSILAGQFGGTDGSSSFTLSDAVLLEFDSPKDYENPDDHDEDGEYEVIVQIRDGHEDSNRVVLTVTLTDVNEAPTAVAGEDQGGVAPGATVTLDGSTSSDPDEGDSDNLKYRWTQTGEPMVTLADANAATTTFTAPSGLTETTALSFTLTVTDGDGLSHEDTVTVTLVPQPPVITSETRFTVAENTTAVATLTATDADTPAAGLEWSIPAGDAGGADGGKFTLTSSGVLTLASAKDFEDPDDDDTDGSYQVTVRVSDNALEATANLTVTLANVNEAPTAVAGDDQARVEPGASVTLDGSASSDPDEGDSDNLIYRWTQAQTGVPAVTLTGADAPTATFTVPGDPTEAAAFTFTLRVTDPGGLSHEDTVTVTAGPAGFLLLNANAIAGDYTVNIAEKATGFDIGGDTGLESGVSVAVTVGTENLNATSADPDAADGDDTATWTVRVPADAAYIVGTGVTVTVSASKTGFTAPSDLVRELAIDLVAPVAPSYAAPASLKVGEAIAATSPSGGSGIDSYRATGLPPGLGIDSSTGAIGGTPDTANASTATATVTVSDAAGNSATVEIEFPAVAKGDQTLSGFQYSASRVAFGSPAPTVTAPTGGQTVPGYSAEPAAVCTVDAVTGALTLVGVGNCVVTATVAATANYNEAAATFTVTVLPANTLVLNVDVIAEDGTVNVAEKVAGFDIEGDTGTESGVSVTVTVGATELTATSADPDTADTDDTATWSVRVPADAAYIAGTSVDVTVSAAKFGFTAPSDVELTLSIDLIEPTAWLYLTPRSLKVGEAIAEMTPLGGADTDMDEYSATGLPPGLVIDAATGVISGTPVTADADTATANLKVSDTAGNTVSVSITFPAVAKGDQSLAGFAYSASSATFGTTAPTLTAPTGVQTTVGYSVTATEVCTVDSATGALTLVGVGDCVVTARAAGTANYNEATATFTVKVLPAGTLALNVAALIATDNIVNIAEKAAGFDIEGDTGSVGGVSVTVTVGGTDLAATSADANNDGTATWTVSVPAGAAYISGTSVAVTVSASKTGYTAPADETRNLDVDLVAPTAPSYAAPASLKVGEAVAAINPTGGTGIDEYSAAGLPSGLTIDAATGAISGTPDAADADTATVTVTASDAADNAATVDIEFPAVAKGDQSLAGFAYSASSATFGTTAPTLTAPTGVQTTVGYSVTAAEVCTVDSATGALTLVGVGDCVVTARAAGTANYNEATATFTVKVLPAGTLALNVAALIATDNIVNIAEKAAGFDIEGDTGSVGGVSVTVTVGGTDLAATSADANNDGTATWTVSVPAGAAYISGTSVAVTVSASKTGYTAPADETRNLAVDLVAPTAPSYAAPASLKVGEAVAAINPTGGTGIDEYSAAGLPSGLTIDAATGAISGTPDAADADTATVTVTASDAADNAATVDIEFPAVAKGDQSLAGFAYSASSATFGTTAPTLTAPTGVQTTVGYSVTATEVCTVDSATGVLTLVGVGDCVVTARAAGTANYNEATATFTVKVLPAGTLALNVAALIATDNIVNIAEKAAGFDIEGDTGSVGGVSVTVTVGGTDLAATSADANNDGTATWTVSVPAGAAYISGTSVAVTVSASKTGYTAPADETRNLDVDLVAPTAPSYAAPASLKVGEAVAAINPTGGTGIDEYSAAGLPSGLTIDAATGAISGTPDAADADTATVTVTASDAADNAATVDIEFPAVAKGDQSLAGFAYSASSATFGTTAPTLTAPTGVQTTVGYSVTATEVCTVDSATGVLTLVGVGDCVVTARAAGTANYNEATATFTVKVLPAGTLALNVAALIATDNIVNIAEKAAGFDIEGDTGSVGGVSVTVTVGGTDLAATSADANNDGTATWTVSVPAGAAYISGTSVAVTVSASKTGYTAPADETRNLDVDLVAPTAPSYAAPASLKVGEAVAAINPTGGTGIDEYSAAGLPSGLTIDAATGAISGTPDAADADTATVTVTASDAADNAATVDIEFPAVAKGDQSLAGFAYSASSATFGTTAPTLTAPTGVQTTVGYSVTATEVCTVDSATGALTLVGVGDCVVTARAAGTANYNEATATFTVKVLPAGTLALNVAALIATDNIVNIAEKAAGFDIEGDTGSVGGVSVTVTVGGTDLAATSADANNYGTATWTVSVPAGAAYISGTSVAVTVSASKTGYTAPADETRNLAVDLVAPTAPSYAAPASLKVGEAVAAINPTGGTGIDEYSAAGLPSGLTIDAATGAISGTPDAADADTATVTVTASDAADNAATVDIEFPAVAKGDQSLAGFAYSASSATFGTTAPTLTAPTGVQTTVGYSVTATEVCTVDSATGVLTLVGVGDCVVTARAAGTANYNEATATFTVKVLPAGTLALNVAALIATDNIVNIAEKAAGFDIEGDTGSVGGVSVTVTVGGTDLAATSADANNDGTATWTVSVPAGAAYISGTSVAVTVSASKTGYTAPADETRNLAVDLVAPTAPSYAAPASLKVGEAVAAINPTGGTGIDEYSAAGLPSGLTIDAATGAISGTPDAADADTATVTVTASDAADNAATVDIEFPAVAKGDQALSGFAYDPDSVTFGLEAPSVTAPSVTVPSGSPGAVTYAAAPSTVCTVNATSGALSLVGAGTCVVTATAAGTADYAEAMATFTVKVTQSDTTAPTVSTTASGYYSDAALTTALTGTQAGGTNVYTKVKFSENVAHTENDGATARPEIFYKIGTGTATQFDIVADSETLASGDCKRKSASDFNEYHCLYTTGTSDSGTFTFEVGTNTQDEAGNALASRYTHATTLALATNTAPTAANSDVTTVQDVAYTFAASDFSFVDTDSDDVLASVDITSLPAAGELRLNDTAIASANLPQTVTKAELDSGSLTFVPPPNTHGAPLTTFMFKVNDGTADSADAYTMSVTVQDGTAPTVVSIARQTPASSLTNANSLTWRVTFSEAVANVDATDFEVSGTTATLTVAAVTGTNAYDVTASGGNLAGLNATVMLSFATGQNIADGAGNVLSNTAPTGVNDPAYVVDNTAPGVTISDVPASSAAAFTAKFTFTESVTGFALADITVGNATTSSFSGADGDTEYTALVTPTADGEVTVDVAADAAADDAGNGSTAATQAVSTYTAPGTDTTKPRVTDIALSPALPPESEDHPRPRTREAFNEMPEAAVHGPGTTLTFTVTFDQAVTVGRNEANEARPELVLDVSGRERRATLIGERENTQSLTFRWTVRRGDYDPDGIAMSRIDLRGATIRFAAGCQVVDNVTLPCDFDTDTFVREYSGEQRKHRVRGGFFTMGFDTSAMESGAREGEHYRVWMRRSGAYDEFSLGTVWVVDSTAENGRLVGVTFYPKGRRGDGVETDGQSGYVDVPIPGDGKMDTERTLTIQLSGTDSGDGGRLNWYDPTGSEEVVVSITDAGIVDNAPLLSVGPADIHEPETGTAPITFRVCLWTENGCPSPGQEPGFDAYEGVAHEVRVDWNTADRTAVAGQDYLAGSGTLVFAPGETVQTVDITVLADAHDEGMETFWLELSNPVGAELSQRWRNWAQIHNDGPIPKAWIARFGRTVAEQVIDAVETRMQAADAPGAQIAMGGAQVKIGAEAEGALDPVDETLTTQAQREAEYITAWLNADSDRVGYRPYDAHDDWGPESEALGARDVLLGSSFALSSGTPGSNMGSLWGRMAASSFNGREDDLVLDGEVTSAMLGADWSQGTGRGAWNAGLIVSRSTADGGWSGGKPSGDGAPGISGEVDATLTGAFPWTRLSLTERLDAWGSVGYGEGRLTVTPNKPGSEEPGYAVETDLSLRMGALGLRGTLTDGRDSAGLILTGKTDALIVQTASDRAVRSDGLARLAAAKATVTRLRLGLEASRPTLLGRSLMLTPLAELGVRHDAGDAETGWGLDVGGGLTLSDAAGTLQAEVRGRGLLSHEAQGLRERGVSGTLSWQQEPSSDRGATLTLTQTVGGASSGGADALLSRATLDQLAADDPQAQDANDDLQARRLDLTFGYGLAAFENRFTFTPQASVGVSDTGRDMSVGWRLTRRPSERESMELSFEARRREDANDDTPPEHELGVQLTVHCCFADCFVSG